MSAEMAIIINLMLLCVALLLWNAKLHGENLRCKVRLYELQIKLSEYKREVKKAVSESKPNFLK